MHVGLRWSRICVGLIPLALFQGLRIKKHMGKWDLPMCF